MYTLLTISKTGFENVAKSPNTDFTCTFGELHKGPITASNRLNRILITKILLVLYYLHQLLTVWVHAGG